MRKTLTQITLAVALGLGAQLQAHGEQVHGDQCGFRTDYDVRVDQAGIAFTRHNGEPASVFMHEGQLRVNGHVLAVNADDAARLRQYEGTVRDVLPEVAGIVREGLDIGFGAMTTVATTFAPSGDERERLLDRLKRDRIAALQRVNAGLGHGVWTQDGLDDVMEESIQGAVSELVSTVTAGAVKAALSGDQAQLAALEARADSLDATIEKEVDARAAKLDARARLLCPRFATLERLQQSFQFRLPDGSPLRLIQPSQASSANSKDAVASR